jgi:hypothetical protein
MHEVRKAYQPLQVEKRKLVAKIQTVKIVILMAHAKNLLKRKPVVQTQTVRIVTLMELVRKNK